MSGIEILGLAASVVQIAELGGQLSVKLFTFTRKVKNANKSIDALSQDIAATGAILNQLGITLSNDDNLKVCSQQAIDTAKRLVDDTHRVFSNLDRLIRGSEERSGRLGISLKQRLRFPFVESEIEQVQVNLERLKSSLLVVLNVLIFAEQLRNQEAFPILQEQRQLIKTLADEKNENEKRYERILKAIGETSIHSNPIKGSVDPFLARNASVTKSNASIDTTTTLVNAVSTSGSQGNLQTQSFISGDGGEDAMDHDKNAATDNFNGAVAAARQPDIDAGLTMAVEARTNEIGTTSQPSQIPAGLKNYSGPLRYHADLVQNLLSEISSLHYQIDHGTRDRMLDGVLDLHHNEWSRIRSIYGSIELEALLTDYEDVSRHWAQKRRRRPSQLDVLGKSFTPTGRPATSDDSQVEVAAGGTQTPISLSQKDETDGITKNDASSKHKPRTQGGNVRRGLASTSSATRTNNADQDYQSQLMILEQQENKRRKQMMRLGDVGRPVPFIESDDMISLRQAVPDLHDRPSGMGYSRPLPRQDSKNFDSDDEMMAGSIAHRRGMVARRQRQQQQQLLRNTTNFTKYSSPQFNLDFTTPEDTGILANFDFDSFLNATAADMAGCNREFIPQTNTDSQFDLDFGVLDKSDFVEGAGSDALLKSLTNQGSVLGGTKKMLEHDKDLETYAMASGGDHTGDSASSTITNSRHASDKYEVAVKKQEASKAARDQKTEEASQTQIMNLSDSTPHFYGLDEVDELILQLTTIDASDLLRSKL